MRRWYLIQTKPSGESVAQTNLERQGYTVYYPRLARLMRWRGRWRDRVVALFPRYLFLHLNEGSQSLGPVRSTLGVNDIVRFGAMPAMVPDQVIAGLRLRAEPDTGLHRLNRSMFEPGTIVRVTSGPFEGVEGIFEREGGCERVVVLLKLLCQNAPVRIPSQYVVPSMA